ncbi:MAG: transcription elongation factor GreA [Clostridia bacterium]|nr:MAG: transcription elongation factor GreA [Clostridia bacterium]
MIKELVMSREGLKKLEAELEELKTVRRKEVAEKIKTALGYGDLSENSEYDEAKNEQAIVEGRIAEIEAQLKHVRILDESQLSDETVHIGSKVCMRNGKGDKVEYKIVGSTESDPFNGMISDESPVGKAVLGHAAGDKVLVVMPSGAEATFEILSISK